MDTNRIAARIVVVQELVKTAKELLAVEPDNATLKALDRFYREEIEDLLEENDAFDISNVPKSSVNRVVERAAKKYHVDEETARAYFYETWHNM